jgi:FAD-linked oxidoreductase
VVTTSNAGAPTWQNWARTEQATPLRVVRPASVDEVADVVRAAARDGVQVKPVGSGHSFTGIAVAPGIQLDLSALDQVRRVDVATGRATVDAGIPLHRLSPWLWRTGLAFANLGDIDRQTLAGAVSTGTHGTGRVHGSLASAVVGLELVLADGSVVTCSADERPDLFRAAQVGLGAFGVVTALTVQCVPAFPMRARERVMPLAQLLGGLDDFVAGHDYAEFFWFPHTTKALVKENDRLEPDAPLSPVPAWRAFLDGEVVANGLLALVSRIGAAAPRRIPAINRLSERFLSEVEYVDRSYKVFASSRRVRFRESEYAIPRAAVPDVLRELGAWLDRPGHEIGFPVEVRFGPPEDAWLATAYRRETAWVAAHTYHRQDHGPYFQAFEKIMSAYEGRPHWGKMHSLGAEALAGLYPRFGDALAVRNDVDPGRLFANPYLERVLGS